MALPVAWFAYWLVFAIVLGAVVGSFLNVCIYRLPLEKSVVWPGSHCPNCLKPVRKRDNIPILSWWRLGGRCRDCGASFSPRYMGVELLTAAVFGLLLWLASPNLTPQLGMWTYYAVLCAGLIAATFIDFDHYIIPDGITVPLMLVGLGAGAVWPDLHLLTLDSPLPNLHRLPRGDFVLYALGVTAGWLLLAAWLVWLWRRRRAGVPGTAEWIIIAVWLVFLLFHTAVLATIVPGVPVWLVRVAALRGFWTGVVGFLVGGGTIWFVRAAAAGFLMWKRRSVARRARRWRALRRGQRGKKRTRRARALEQPGYFDAWLVIFGGVGRMTEWRRLGPWIAKEGMGFGDVTLMAAIGAFLGWQGAVVTFFAAPFMGLAVNLFHWLFRGTRQIPYGPYLSVAALLVIATWDALWPQVLERVDAVVFLMGLAIG